MNETPIPETKTEGSLLAPPRQLTRREKKAAAKARRRHAIEPVMIGARDCAVVIRENGRVKIHHARGEAVVGSPAFWGYLFQWLLRDHPDAEETRKILIDDFTTELQEHRKKQLEAMEKAVVENEIRENAAEQTEPADWADLGGRLEVNALIDLYVAPVPAEEPVAEVPADAVFG